MTTMPMPSATFLSARNIIVHYSHIHISFYESMYWNWMANTHTLTAARKPQTGSIPLFLENMYEYLLVQRSKSQNNIKLSENPRLLTYHVKIFAEGQNKTLITSPGLFQSICETRLRCLCPTVIHDKECKTPPLTESVPAVLQEQRR